MINHADCTVVIPTFNEAGNITPLLERITALCPGIKCLVADDGSSDGTRDEVRHFAAKNPGVSLLDRSAEPVKGLSAAVWDGILKCDTRLFVVMDGDGQHPPEYIERCLESLSRGADLSVGTRERFGLKWSFSRILTSSLAGGLARARLLLSGVIAQDPMSGFFGGRTEFAEKIHAGNSRRFALGGYKILFDILKSLPDGTRLTGFEFPFGVRGSGASKLSFKVILSMLLSVAR
jgi:dolichol-phosphate mannosyltransferase